MLWRQVSVQRSMNLQELTDLLGHTSLHRSGCCKEWLAGWNIGGTPGNPDARIWAPGCFQEGLSTALGIISSKRARKHGRNPGYTIRAPTPTRRGIRVLSACLVDGFCATARWTEQRRHNGSLYLYPTDVWLRDSYWQPERSASLLAKSESFPPRIREGKHFAGRFIFIHRPRAAVSDRRIAKESWIHIRGNSARPYPASLEGEDTHKTEVEIQTARYAHRSGSSYFYYLSEQGEQIETAVRCELGKGWTLRNFTERPCLECARVARL